MFDGIENLKLISASQGVIKNPAKIESRKLHSFVFRTSGAVTYYFKDHFLTVHAGELVYLPKGASYEYKLSKEECGYVSISFEADITDCKPEIYSLADFSDAGYICNHFVSLWKLGNTVEKFRCYSLFYSILSYISTIDNVSYANGKKFDLLTPALEYLKQHIFDVNLRADTLHKLCGISDTYFRRIFVSKFGTTPQKYITDRRLAYAKSVLDGGRTESIGDLAMSVGYSDALYFSRAFKKKYGTSPTNSERDI